MQTAKSCFLASAH